jgi:alpha-L-arabinofuranosidase
MKSSLLPQSLLFALYLLTGSCSSAESDTADIRIEKKTAKETLLCLIDTTKELRQIDPRLYGSNIEWFHNGNGVVDDKGNLDPRFGALAKEQGMSLLRFPGGTLSDYYHWEDGIGPVEGRPIRPHVTDPGKSANVFGTPEFLEFCGKANAEPLITVNAGTGSASEAAAWVRYCNSPNDSRRVRDGIPKPANVKLWEIGNELYLPENPGDKEIALTPEAYADRFVDFASAMRDVDPTIQLIAIGTANSSRIPLPYPDWTKTVLQRAAGEIDFIAVHNAYFPMIFQERSPGVKDVYQSLWASPEAVDRSLTALERLIEKYEKQRKIGIAITEWGALFSFEPEWVDHPKTLGTAVYAARMMQVFISHPRVQIANYFKFTGRYFMGWVSYDAIPKVPYYVIQLFARHFGSIAVESKFDSPTYSVDALGVAQKESQVPEVTCIASLNNGKDKLFVNFVNRSWTTSYRVLLDVDGTRPKTAEALAWTITSEGPTDHNGPSLPPEWHMARKEPKSFLDSEKTIRIEQSTINPSQSVELPRFSVTTLELDITP